MPRRSISQDRNKKDLRTMDPESQEYWEEVLRREGLSMSRGTRSSKVAYIGNSKDLENTRNNSALPSGA